MTVGWPGAQNATGQTVFGAGPRKRGLRAGGFCALLFVSIRATVSGRFAHPDMKPFYITTAIDYANGSPHLGHAYEKVLTYAIARVRRLRGEPVHFLTGLDEHGQKVQASARARGLEPQAICDVVAGEFQALLRTLEISNDDYIRTTEPRHKNAVRAVLQKLYDQGDIYLGEYRGYYSARQ